jgi:hypothetical protein
MLGMCLLDHFDSGVIQFSLKIHARNLGCQKRSDAAN